MKVCLSIYDLLLPTGVKGLKGVQEVFKEQSNEIRSILPAEFFEKAVLKIFGKLVENHLPQSAYSNLVTILNMSSVKDVFLGIPGIFRTTIFKENLPMDVPYLIKERLWMSASDEAALKIIIGGSKPSSKLTMETKP